MRRALFIDALGTTLRLRPPWEQLDPDALGVTPERLRRGFVAEMNYYRERSEEGRDPDSLADLRRRCASILSREVGVEIDVETMMSAIRFDAYPDAAPALSAARAVGAVTVVVSNWDCSLPGVLARLGLAEYTDGVVTSAAAGARKPDPAIFDPALALAGCAPADALHVGDSAEDVAAAAGAGIDALRIDRGGGGDIASLNEISEHLRR